MQSQYLFSAITLAIAMIGAVLGIFNTFRSWFLDRERIRIKTDLFLTRDGDAFIGVEITNIGFVPVTINCVELIVDKKHGGFIQFPAGSPGCGYLPESMEPRTSRTIAIPRFIYKDERIRYIRGSRAISACCRVFREYGFVLEKIIPDSQCTSVPAGQWAYDRKKFREFYERHHRVTPFIYDENLAANMKVVLAALDKKKK